MAYQVLARKYRPRNFTQLVGQQHVLLALSNALNHQRLHHAYLFTGTRGVGKTTIARILAKCLSCEVGISATPCEQCSNCQAVDAGRFIDLIEVDAASRTKVEDTRELLDNVQYAPTAGRFKIYLIDEVHMLSGHSFNALLKTLEEPPEHVKFLLATTDPQKLPMTILSRCLQFHLKNMLPEEITTQLQTICAAENIQFELSGLQQLAQAADGSLRDALSLLDQASALTNQSISESAMHQMLGTIDHTHTMQLLRSLADHNALQIHHTINQLAMSGSNFEFALTALLHTLHRIAVAQAIPEIANELPQDLRDLCAQISREDVQLFYQIALNGRRDLALAPTTQSGFEMTLLRMMSFRPVTPTSGGRISSSNTPQTNPTTQRQHASESAATQMGNRDVVARTERVAATERAATTEHVAATEHVAPIANEKSSAPISVAISSTDAIAWETIVPQLQLSGVTHEIACNCTLESLTATHAKLIVAPQHAALLNPKHQQRIATQFSQYLQRDIHLTIEIGSSTQATPAAIAALHDQEQLQNAKQTLASDVMAQAIVNRFGASVVTDTIKPTTIN